MNFGGKQIGCGTIILGLIVLDILASILSEEPLGGLIIIALVCAFIFRKQISEKLNNNSVSSKYEEYKVAVGDYLDTPVSYIANVCEVSEEKATADLYEMIGKGHFVNAYFDNGYFIVPGNKKIRDKENGPFADGAPHQAGQSGQSAGAAGGQTGAAAGAAGASGASGAGQTHSSAWDDAASSADQGDGGDGSGQSTWENMSGGWTSSGQTDGQAGGQDAYSEASGADYDAEEAGAAPHMNGIPCPYCGEPIPRTLKFCYFCGKSLEVIQEIEQLRHESLQTVKEAMSVELEEDVKQNIVSIGEISDKILKRFEEEPDLIEDQHRFKDYYLPKTLNAIKNYKELCTMPELDRDEKAVKKQIEDSLDVVESAFARILKKVSVDGIFDLSADVSTLNKALEQEGLTDPDFEVNIEE